MAVALAAGCIAPDVSATIAGGFVGLDGAFGASDGGAVQSTDLTALGLAGNEPGFTPRVDFDWKGIHLSLNALFLDRSGDGELTGELNLGGTVINAATPVASRMDMDVLSAAVTWDLVPSERFELALGFGLHVVDLATTVDVIATGERASTDERMPVPYLAARANLVDWPVGVGLTLGKLDIGLPGLDLETFDLDLFVEWRAFGRGDRATGYAVLGYRRLDLAAEYDDVDSGVVADFTLEALTLGLRFDF